MVSKGSVSRGAFIVIEGLDRSGKTIQVKRLEAQLSESGKKVKVLRFPDRTTPIGQMINSYLQGKTDLEDHVIHLLFSANRWEVAKLIENEITQGYTIICDRYTYSGMVYSAAKMNPLLSLEWARNPDVSLPRPDVVVFLDLHPDEAVKRGGYGDEAYEKRDFQERVRAIFHRLKESGQEESEDMVVIDADGSVEEVSQKIVETVQTKMAAVERGEMGSDIRRIKQWPQENLTRKIGRLDDELKQADEKRERGKREREKREREEGKEKNESGDGDLLSAYRLVGLFAK